MGLTTPLFTALSGLSANSTAISVAGNNIANVNTTAFKNSRASFETQISETLSQGSAPTGDLGGTNQVQIGLGTRIGAIDRNFNNGSLQPTGVNTDLAVEGSGFFVVNFAGETRYTRAGGFSLNSEFNLVNQDGGLLQGFGIDEDFNIVEGVLRNVNIPLGAMTLAKATTSIQFAGNLNVGGDVATEGSLITSGVMLSAPGVPAVGADLLTALEDDAGAAMFADGDVITITGATRGGSTIPDHTFEVGGDPDLTDSDAVGTTVDDLIAFIQDILGIHTTTAEGDPLGDGAGVTLVDGEISIVGNTGESNDLTLAGGNFVVNRDTTPAQPLTFSKERAADGEAVRTTFVAFDSLGTPLTMTLSIALESKTDIGTTWRFYANSEDDSALGTVVGTGLMNFDSDGRLISVTDETVTISREGTGALSPQEIKLDFLGTDRTVSALRDEVSQLSATNQDGAAIGTLDDFNIDNGGTIAGIFSNGLERDLGRVVLATFVNPQGLLDVGGNLFNTTSNSGNASILNPGTSGSGRIVGGALELSNVDLSQEFINLIISSTGFSANSRVLTTSDELIQELLATIR